MVWNDNINSLLDRLADAEFLYKKGFGNAEPSKPNVLLDGLSGVKEVETILLYEITSKGFFNLDSYEEKYGKNLVDSVKMLQELELCNNNYKELLSRIKEEPHLCNVRLQILKQRCRSEEIYNGGKINEANYTGQYYRDKKEIDFLRPMVFRGILRTMKTSLYDRVSITVYNIDNNNVVIEKSTSNHHSHAEWTVPSDIIESLKDIPINYARLWCYRWDYPIKNHAPGTHNDSFILSSNNCKVIGTDENAKTTELCFENGVAINNCPIEESNYAYDLVKQVFSILQNGGVDLYELDRKGELY